MHATAGLDDVVLALPGVELQPLGRPSRSQSLYRLRYPGSFCMCTYFTSEPSQ
jgi:hypothetical protein